MYTYINNSIVSAWTRISLFITDLIAPSRILQSYRMCASGPAHSVLPALTNMIVSKFDQRRSIVTTKLIYIQH